MMRSFGSISAFFSAKFWTIFKATAKRLGLKLRRTIEREVSKMMHVSSIAKSPKD
jgi:hypothetical protein